MKFELLKRPDSINSDLDLFRRSISSVFDDFLGLSSSELFENQTLPSIDLEEDNKGYYMKAELPGVSENNIKLELNNNILVLSGSKKSEKRGEDETRKLIFSETSSGSFYRSIQLPEGVDSDGIVAEYKNGVVSVFVPKKEPEHQKNRNIKIKVQ